MTIEAYEEPWRNVVRDLKSVFTESSIVVSTPNYSYRDEDGEQVRYVSSYTTSVSETEVSRVLDHVRKFAVTSGTIAAYTNLPDMYISGLQMNLCNLLVAGNDTNLINCMFNGCVKYLDYIAEYKI